MDEIEDELRKMIEQEEAIIQTTRMLANMYKGFIESGLPEHIAIDLVKFYMGVAISQITKGNNNDE